MKKISGMLKSSKVGVDDDDWEYFSIQKLVFILKKVDVDDVENICSIVVKNRFLFSTYKGLPGFAGKGAEKDNSKERNSCGSIEEGFYIFSE